MMNNKGFVFIETIITTLVLLTTILVLYSAYSTSINGEKKRLYYDDVSHIYRSELIANVLTDSIDVTTFNENSTIKMGYVYIFNYNSDIYSDNNNLVQLYEKYQWKPFIYIPFDNINDVKSSLSSNNNRYFDSYKDKNNSNDCNSFSDAVKNKCITYTEIITYGEMNLRDYLLTIDVEEIPDATGILIIPFSEAKSGKVLKDNYTSCINEGNKIMDCELADYISWVYINLGGE